MNRPPITGAPMPERGKDVFYVEPVKAGVRFAFRVWSPAVWGVWTHYHEFTSPCYEKHEHCPDKHDPETLRWKGYLFGWHQGINKPAFVQLTSALCESWWEQLAEGVPLRGQLVQLSRGPKKNSRLKVELCPYQAMDGRECPPDLSPRASLYNLWKLPDPGWAWAKSPVRAWMPDSDRENARVS